MLFHGIWRASGLLTALFASSLALAAPPQIALLLPQSGRMAKAAETIRDGFLAAYYQDSSSTADSPSLRFYDSDTADIITLLNQARADGASLIIGPLDRERLEVLIKAGPLGIPVLALNSIEGSAPDLFQFALSPEDEILRLTEWMSAQKIRQPLLLAGNDEASQRQVKLFVTAWQQHRKGELPVVTLDMARKGGIVASVKELTRQGGRHDALFLATPALARQGR